MSEPLYPGRTGKKWARMEEEGLQVMDSIILGRPVHYYVFQSKTGIPVIALEEAWRIQTMGRSALQDHEWDPFKDKKLHKKVVGEIINKLTEGL